jgi:hypothetical protein
MIDNPITGLIDYASKKDTLSINSSYFAQLIRRLEKYRRLNLHTQVRLLLMLHRFLSLLILCFSAKLSSTKYSKSLSTMLHLTPSSMPIKFIKCDKASARPRIQDVFGDIRAGCG